MNARKAKALCKQVYGDGSKRPRRLYQKHRSGVIRLLAGSPRAVYQTLKRQAKCQSCKA